MEKINILAALCLAVCFAGCKKRPDNPLHPKVQDVDQIETQVPDAATQVGVSTSGKIGAMLNAPGNYVNGMVSDVDKAKKAAALYTQKAAAAVNADPGNGK